MSFADLLGEDVSPVLRKRGRPPTNKQLVDETAADRNALGLDSRDSHKIASGVPIPWLVRVFRMPRQKLERALLNCPILRTTNSGTPVYDVKTAARYLIDMTPQMEAYLQTIKAADLPEKLRETYWNAKIKEAKYRVMAGELWPTQAVMDVLGETFKTIKKTTQLWADTIGETSELSDAQRALIIQLVDRLLDDTHQALVMQSRDNQTESHLAELDADDDPGIDI